MDVHGEAELVDSYGPGAVLDAGCGTGRVAIELSRRGHDVVGVDVDPAMLEAARAKAPELKWVEGDLTDPTLDLGPAFDIVVMAGQRPHLRADRQPRVRSSPTRRAGWRPEAASSPATPSVPEASAPPSTTHWRPAEVSCSRTAGRPGTARPLRPGDGYAVSVHRQED